MPHLKKYASAADKFLSSVPRSQAWSLFEGAGNEGTAGQKHLLESLVKDESLHLHPNAVRYFLIQTRNKMDEAKQKAREDAKAKKDLYNKFMSAPARELDLAETGVDALRSFKPKGLFQKKKNTEKLDAVRSKMKTALKNLEESVQFDMQAQVYEIGVAYLDRLIASFNSFYDAFRDQIGRIDERREEIYRKYRQTPGMTVRYIAADEESLKQLVARYPYTGSMLNVDPKLASSIITKVFNLAKSDEKKNSSLYFRDIFDEQILPHYRNEAHDKVAADLDVGIVKAIELEATLKLNESQRSSQSAIDQYVRDTLKATRTLATPFIEKPADITATEIDACAYHPSILPGKGDQSLESKLIQEELTARGGQEDEDVDKNMIIFYKSYYGLRANSLSKFAPPAKSVTNSRNGGEYYTAYTELVRGIRPIPGVDEVQEITPHLDKSWHLAAKMPDLDEQNQMIEEYGINAAFFWALVLNLLNLKSDASRHHTYELNAGRLELDDGVLLTDEGEPAESLDQVLEALAGQTLQVDTLRSHAEKQIRKDMENSRGLSRASVYRQLESIIVPLSAGKDRTSRSITLYDLPALVNGQTLRNGYPLRRLLALFEVAVKETVSYISGFCTPEDLGEALRVYFSAQYDTFRDSLGLNGSSGLTGKAADDVVTETMEKAANLLDEYRLAELATRIRQDADVIRRNA